MSTTAEATAAAEPATVENDHVVTRDEMNAATKTRHGFYKLPNGSRILFSSLRRSVLYAIDADLFGEDGKVDSMKLRERPARIMTAVLCDAQGNRMFKDDEWERVDALKPSIFEPLWKAIRKHLDLDQDADEADTKVADPKD